MTKESFSMSPEELETKDEITEQGEDKPVKPGSKKSGWFKRAIAIGGTMAATSFGNMDAKAGDADITDGFIESEPKIERVEQDAKMMEVDETKLTVASLWSREALANAKAELKELQTKEDSSAFFESTFKDFFYELKWPSADKGRGDTRLTRNGSRDDFEFLFNNALEMSRIAEDLLGKFDYTEEQKANVRSLFEPRLAQLKDQASYHSEKKREMWRKYLKKDSQN